MAVRRAPYFLGAALGCLYKRAGAPRWAAGAHAGGGPPRPAPGGGARGGGAHRARPAAVSRRRRAEPPRRRPRPPETPPACSSNGHRDLLREVAGGAMVARLLLQRRLQLGTGRGHLGDGAARMKPAARWRVDRRRDLSAEVDNPSGGLNVPGRGGNRLEERLGGG